MIDSVSMSHPRSLNEEVGGGSCISVRALGEKLVKTSKISLFEPISPKIKQPPSLFFLFRLIDLDYQQ